jgi:putative redox protein
MVKIKVEYLGDLRCEVEHTPTGTRHITDAPLDNNGQARSISPTDSLAGAIGSCIATIMGIKAQTMNVDLTGMIITVSKEMQNKPYRRISKLIIDILFPHQLEKKELTIFSNVIKSCPVTRSLHPDIELEQNITFKED